MFAALVICFWPAGHAIVEHFALAEQQVAIRPSLAEPYFVVAKIWPLPQDTERHLVESVSQHVDLSEVPHTFVAHLFVPAFSFCPAVQIFTVHVA
jgi:hypothetical protein